MDSNKECETPEMDQRFLDRLFTYESETRWIFAWNSWIKILEMRLFHDVPLSEVQHEEHDEIGLGVILQDFQASYEISKSSYWTDYVNELLLGLKVWREVQRQSINVLFYAEQTLSEEKEFYKLFPMVRKIEIEVEKKRLAETIGIASQKVEKYRNNLNSAAVQLKIQHQKHPNVNIDKIMTLVFRALFQKVDLARKSIIARCLSENQEESIKKANRHLNIPELFKPLFVGRSEFEENPGKDFQAHVSTLLEILQTGTEWYLGWTIFTEEILHQIKATLPENVSKANLYENTITNGQLALLKSLLLEVKSIADCRIKSVMTSLLAVLDCFINLLEKTKEESEFWVHNVNSFLTELGEEDVNDVSSGNRTTHKLFILKTAIQDKNRHIHISVLYLYKEINRVIDYIRTEFVGSDDYTALEGMTSSLLEQYTENRKERMGPVPHEKNDSKFPRFEYPKDDDLKTSLGLSPEILMKMSLDDKYCTTEEDKFWSDSMSFDLDKNVQDDVEYDAETLKKMKYFTDNIKISNQPNIDETESNPTSTEKDNPTNTLELDDTENVERMYGATISPEVTAFVQNLNDKLSKEDSPVESQKDD